MSSSSERARRGFIVVVVGCRERWVLRVVVVCRVSGVFVSSDQNALTGCTLDVRVEIKVKL